MLLSALACGKDEVKLPPYIIPDTEEYGSNISFEKLTIDQVQQFLQEQGKWIIEDKYMSDVDDYIVLYYYPPGSEKYFEFIGKDTLLLFTDTVVITYRIQWETSTFLRLFDTDSTETYFSMPGILNYRLQLFGTENKSKIRFDCIPEKKLSDLPKPDLSQKDLLAELSIYQIMQLLSGTKWKMWQICRYSYDYCIEMDPDEYIAFEFIGTNTLRFIRDSVAEDYEIGPLYEEGNDHKGFHSSYPFYRTLEEAGISYSFVEIFGLSDKKMKIKFKLQWITDLEEPGYICVLVE